VLEATTAVIAALEAATAVIAVLEAATAVIAALEATTAVIAVLLAANVRHWPRILNIWLNSLARPASARSVCSALPLVVPATMEFINRIALIMPIMRCP
jgi:hypothetical protein